MHVNKIQFSEWCSAIKAPDWESKSIHQLMLVKSMALMYVTHQLYMWVNSQILVSSSAFVRLCVRAVNALHHQQPTEGQTTDECFYFEGEKCLPELQFPSAWKQHMSERSPIRTDLGDTLRCLTGFCITRLWVSRLSPEVNGDFDDNPHRPPPRPH